MTQHSRMLLITFLESFATVLMERGFYFYAHENLDYSEAQNLTVAFVHGLAYVIGAVMSHRASDRLTEKRLMVLVIASQLLLHLVIAAEPAGVVIAGCFIVLGWVNGLKWPVIESYVSAGQTPRDTIKVIGRFNLCWSASVPLAVASVGVIVASSWPGLVGAVPAAINLLVLLLLVPFTARPEHLSHDHPERPDPTRITRYRRLLRSSRWSMMGSYGLLFLLAPLIPTIFEDLGHDVEMAAGLSALLDVLRVVAFVGMWCWHGWYGRTWPVAMVIPMLPVGFCMVMFGDTTATVLVGEVIYGLASGVCYYAALYYAIVILNASVDAGGGHESMIGVGFAMGPGIGLVGLGLAEAVGGYERGMLMVTMPILLFLLVVSVRPLLRRHLPADQPTDQDRAG